MDDMVSGSGQYTGVVFTDMATMEVFHAGDLGLSFVLNNQGDSPNPTTLLGGNQYCALLSGTPTRWRLSDGRRDSGMGHDRRAVFGSLRV